MELPELLRKVRRDRDFSQENVAEEIKVDVSTYARYEKGETQIKFEHIVKLAEFYNMSLDEFYHYGDPDFVINEPTEKYKTKTKVSVIVELDGGEHTLNKWIKKLTAINSII